MNVLILTDLSEVARNAGSYAVQFLGDIPVNFYMLNIREFNPEASLEEEKKELALRKLHQRMDELQEISQNKDHKFFALYSESDLLTATRKYADEKNVDLIVMGAAHKGHSPFTIIGNHTYEVIKKIRYNILAVAEHCQYKPLKKMIFPIAYSTSLNKDVLAIFNKPQIAEGTALTVVEVGDPAKGVDVEAGREIFSQIKNRKVKVIPFKDKNIFSDDNLQKIQDRFDMIVMMGKNLGLCDSFLHTKRGIYSKVSNSLPILVLH